MRRRLSDFAPALRLLAVFGVGAAGVHAALPLGDHSAVHPAGDSGVSQALFGRSINVSNVDDDRLQYRRAIPWPSDDELTTIALSRAMFDDLANDQITLPLTARFHGAAPAQPTPPAPLPSDPLFANQTAMPVEHTTGFINDDLEISAGLPDIDAAPTGGESPLAYSEPPNAGSPADLAVNKTEAVATASSPAASAD